MPRPEPSMMPPPGPRRESGLDRRRFLAGLGLLAGAGALSPLLRRLRPAAMASIEAGRPLMAPGCASWRGIPIVIAPGARSSGHSRRCARWIGR